MSNAEPTTPQEWRALTSLRSPTEERNPRTMDLDTLPATEIIERILAEDASVLARVQALSPQIGALAEACVTAIDAGGTVHYVGAGTSGRLAVLDAVELAPTYNAGPEYFTAHLAGGADAMLVSAEGLEDSEAAGATLVEECGAHDVVIGLAASGRTPYVRGAMAAARARGLVTGLVSANPHAELAELADHPILTDTGPEAVTGSTRMKAATAQKLVLNALSTATMVRLGKTYSNLMIDVRATNQKLIARTVRMLVQATDVDVDTADATLRAAHGNVRVALVALLSGVGAGGVHLAEAALDRHPTDPGRVGDAAGIRAAVQEVEAGS
ncbi:N-acetylmuramic acid 6-phosphate etherase [Parenemella sanctibonifatiensis]|uniref:N-acetylmuramic acid 6-phosphate etherase n=1 Tax=Parenemella sanctibonifatiensis TaxID=2016505 RepID=A0A255ECA5_9ACTN|nr:N-acetylmuramic acid 6-phosphate etherase [Parenemella sanctibonifatiensis]OYN88561.1 N-acetylmuramic acid 6-phosphate etherase [Parenemella sanctibonifatiensis]